MTWLLLATAALAATTEAPPSRIDKLVDRTVREGTRAPGMNCVRMPGLPAKGWSKLLGVYSWDSVDGLMHVFMVVYDRESKDQKPAGLCLTAARYTGESSRVVDTTYFTAKLDGTLIAARHATSETDLRGFIKPGTSQDLHLNVNLRAVRRRYEAELEGWFNDSHRKK